MPRHVNSMMPTSETQTRKRVRVMKAQMVRDGGSCALADFQVIPPFGRSIVDVYGSVWSGLDVGSLPRRRQCAERYNIHSDLRGASKRLTGLIL